MNFEEFKSNATLVKEKLKRNDIINLDTGTMLIYQENLNKYLERYACKDSEDLEDTMWLSYGVYVKILD